MAQLFTPPFQTTLDDNGEPISGAIIHFYASGTATPAAIYTDAGLSTPLPNPIIADSAGRFSAIYLNPDILYRVVIADAGGTPIRDVDPVGDVFRRDLTSASGGSLIPFSIQSANARQRNLLDKGRETPSVFDFIGIHGDGVSSDRQAFQRAIDHQAATGEKIVIPAADVRYLIDDTLVVGHNYFDFVGDGPAKATIRATTSAPMLLINGRYGRLDNILFDANHLALHGIIARNGAQSILEQVGCANAISHGMLFDTGWGGGANGNNNTFEVRNGQLVLNNGVGIWVKQQGDNNALRFINVSCSSNTSHGLMLKAEGGVVLTGLFEGNGGVGIQLGEASDPAVVTANRIICPWIESNTGGGVYGGKSAGNKIIFGNNAQSYTGAAGSMDYVETYDNGGNMVWASAVAALFASLGASGLVNFGVSPSSPGTNVDLALFAKGTGRIKPQQDVDLAAGAVLRSNGVQVVGAQQPAITAPSGGTTIDTQARTALGAILTALRTHGLIAS